MIPTISTYYVPTMSWTHILCNPPPSNKKEIVLILDTHRNFPGGAVVENPPASAGDTGSIPGLGRAHMPRSN